MKQKVLWSKILTFEFFFSSRFEINTFLEETHHHKCFWILSAHLCTMFNQIIMVVGSDYLEWFVVEYLKLGGTSKRLARIRWTTSISFQIFPFTRISILNSRNCRYLGQLMYNINLLLIGLVQYNNQPMQISLSKLFHQ